VVESHFIEALSWPGVLLRMPHVVVDAAQIARLRASGASWPSIALQLGVSVGTVFQAGRKLSKIPSKTPAASD
jgi:hypothetical protein